MRVQVSLGAPYRKLAQLVEHLAYTENVIGSNPVLPTKFIRSVAQSGSAPGLGPGGPRFESLYSDHSFIDRNAHRCAAGLLIRVSLVRSQIGQPILLVHSVMVALQILILSVKVRTLVGLPIIYFFFVLVFQFVYQFF